MASSRYSAVVAQRSPGSDRLSCPVADYRIRLRADTRLNRTVGVSTHHT
ncbi:hypothetical protein [Nocardia abscessus]|nr:hypothetical protein [Nocardia abscessus]